VTDRFTAEPLLLPEPVSRILDQNCSRLVGSNQVRLFQHASFDNEALTFFGDPVQAWSIYANRIVKINLQSTSYATTNRDATCIRFAFGGTSQQLFVLVVKSIRAGFGRIYQIRNGKWEVDPNFPLIRI
jgi:hypothetical protein